MINERDQFMAVSLASFCVILGCGSGDLGTSEAVSNDQVTSDGVPARIHLFVPRPMIDRVRDPAAAAGTGSSPLCGPGDGPHPHLTNGGGSLMRHVRIYNVAWGNVPDAARLNQFTGWLAGAYLGGLGEYGIQSGSSRGWQSVGSNPPGTVSDGDIQGKLSHLVATGKLPDDDTSLFMVWLAPGVTVATDWNGGSRSCRDFCAYHGSYQPIFGIFGNHRRYAVIPDLTSCDNGCGWQGNDFDDRTLVASHEIAESTTDPDPNSAWYDGQDSYGVDANGHPTADGEIGDICNQQAYVWDGYTVQCEWSNRANGCVDFIPPPPCLSGGAACGTGEPCCAGLSCQYFGSSLTCG